MKKLNIALIGLSLLATTFTASAARGAPDCTGADYSNWVINTLAPNVSNAFGNLKRMVGYYSTDAVMTAKSEQEEWSICVKDVTFQGNSRQWIYRVTWRTTWQNPVTSDTVKNTTFHANVTSVKEIVYSN